MPYFPALPAVWLTAANLAGLALMGWDKHCARRARRRVPEKVLFLAALLGGAAGVLGRDVPVPPQDPALVLCGGHAADPGLPGCAGGVAVPLRTAPGKRRIDTQKKTPRSTTAGFLYPAFDTPLKKARATIKAGLKERKCPP